MRLLADRQAKAAGEAKPEQPPPERGVGFAVFSNPVAATYAMHMTQVRRRGAARAALLLPRAPCTHSAVHVAQVVAY